MRQNERARNVKEGETWPMRGLDTQASSGSRGTQWLPHGH